MARRKTTYVQVPEERVDKVAMVLELYKCRDCGTLFVREEDGVNCPNCGTNDCRVVGE